MFNRMNVVYNRIFIHMLSFRVKVSTTNFKMHKTIIIYDVQTFILDKTG